MRPTCHPHLINGPFEDPGLFLPFVFDNRAFIFDMGDTDRLSAKDALKISHAFITHTHMDHFSGFDRLLRLFLGREKVLKLFGPEDFLHNIEGKLAGYSWNLVKNFDYRFVLDAVEVREKELFSRRYPCQTGFAPVGEAVSRPFDGTLVSEPDWVVSAAILDHGIPCLGFCLKERFHINVIKEGMAGLGLSPGPWLRSFKRALYENRPLDSEFTVWLDPDPGGLRSFVLGDLAERIARITAGQKIAYVADTAFTRANADRIVELSAGADHLFIEAAFLEKDRHIAKRKAHLTARQAGAIAARARVKAFTVFHFSPRYSNQGHLLYAEAREAFLDPANRC